MILAVADPNAMFDQAIRAAATEVYAVSEGHGWRIGRVMAPFGHHRFWPSSGNRPPACQDVSPEYYRVVVGREGDRFFYSRSRRPG